MRDGKSPRGEQACVAVMVASTVFLPPVGRRKIPSTL
jgi:hypothetical protein